MDTQKIVQNALAAGYVVPAFNIPHLPMMEPITARLPMKRASA